MARTLRIVAPSRISLLVTGLFIVAVTAARASAATLSVANDGVDGASCGGKASPCRSISRGVANANPGDTLIVGPGRYGDLDGDADFNDAGEETGPSQACSCIVFVNKPLTIVSQSGAAATVIDGGRLGGSVVKISEAGSGTVFGKKRKGFTIRGGGNGLTTDGAVNGATITSNIATGNDGTGFNVFGSTGVQLTANISAGNGFAGFAGVSGFAISGSGNVVRGNVATANDGDGFALFFGSAIVVGNVANANRARGFTLSSGDYVVQGNSAIGNLRAGIAVATSGAMTKNNLFGNNTIDDFGLTNCGIRALGGATIDASKNFWGAATGPGADPADDACATGVGTTIVAVPFATKAFKVKALP